MVWACDGSARNLPSGPVREHVTMTGAPRPNPVTEGVRSLEVRWIFPGQLETAVAGWFGRFPALVESREDSYLLDPQLPGLSVKVRGGGALEVKAYRGSPGLLEVPGRARGRLEFWQKWSFPFSLPRQDGGGAAGWRTVRKRRRISRFSPADGRIVAPSPGLGGGLRCEVDSRRSTRVTSTGGPWGSRRLAPQICSAADSRPPPRSCSPKPCPAWNRAQMNRGRMRSGWASGRGAGSDGCPSEAQFSQRVVTELPEGQMSILSRKRAAEADADTRHRMQQPARPVVLARAAVPMVKTAGTTARGQRPGCRGMGRARVNGARAWTAPRIERSGLAIKDTIAPRISETLTATARRVDVTAPRLDVTASRRRWPRVAAGTVLLAAVGAAAAIVLRRRNDDGTRGQPGKQPARAPARRPHKTVRRAPTAATRKQT